VTTSLFEPKNVVQEGACPGRAAQRVVSWTDMAGIAACCSKPPIQGGTSTQKLIPPETQSLAPEGCLALHKACTAGLSQALGL
jgi:hypothetical protein